jgi:hypothetical protein
MQRNRNNPYDASMDPDQGASPWHGPAEFPYREQPGTRSDAGRYGMADPYTHGRQQGRPWGSGQNYPNDRADPYAGSRGNWGPGSYGDRSYGDQEWGNERPRRDAYQGGYGAERTGWGSRNAGRPSDYDQYRSEDPRESYGYGGGDPGGRYNQSAQRGYSSGGYDAGQDYGSRSGGYGSGYAGGSSGGGAYGSSQGSGQNYGQSYGQSRGSMYADISPVDEHDTSGGTWRSGTMGERRSPKGYTRSDDRIREDVNDRLMQDYRVDPGDIEVSVEKGEVTLKGDVRSREEKFRAEQIAESVSGVSDVTNNLRVKKRSRNADSSTRSGEDNRVDSQSESKSSSGNSGISPIAGISSAGGSRTGTTSGSQSRNT